MFGESVADLMDMNFRSRVDDLIKIMQCEDHEDALIAAFKTALDWPERSVVTTEREIDTTNLERELFGLSNSEFATKKRPADEKYCESRSSKRIKGHHEQVGNMENQFANRHTDDWVDSDVHMDQVDLDK